MADFAEAIGTRLRSITKTIDIAVQRAVRDDADWKAPGSTARPAHQGMSHAQQLHELQTRLDLQTRRLRYDEKNEKRLLLEVGEAGHGLDEGIKQALDKTGRGPLSKNIKPTSSKDLADYVDLLATSVYLDEWVPKETNIAFEDLVADPLASPVSTWKPLPQQLRGLDEDSTDEGVEARPVQASKRNSIIGTGGNIMGTLAPPTGPLSRPTAAPSDPVGQAVNTTTNTSTIVVPPAMNNGQHEASEVEYGDVEASLLANKRQGLAFAAVDRGQTAQAMNATQFAPMAISAAALTTVPAVSSTLAEHNDYLSGSSNSSDTSAIDREKALASMAPKRLTAARVFSGEHISSTHEASATRAEESSRAPSYSPLDNPGDSMPNLWDQPFVESRRHFGGR